MEINTAESTLIMDHYQQVKRGRTPASNYTGREQRVHSPQQIVLLRQGSQQVRQLSSYPQQVQQIQKIQSQQVMTNRGIVILPQTTAYQLVQPDEAFRQRCGILERQVQELQQELMKVRNTQPQERITYVEDSSRCTHLEQQVESQQNELQRLITIIRDNDIEMEQWRQRAALLQQQLNNKDFMQQDTERMKKIYNENEQFFQTEIQRLNQALQISNQQIQNMQQAIIQQKQIETRYTQQIQESQFLTSEIESLNSLFKNKTDEFTQLKNRFQIQLEDAEQRNQQLQQNIRQVQAEWEERYQNEVKQRKEEVNRLSQATSALQLALKDTSKLQEYETRSKAQNEEISRLNIQLRQKTDEIERLRQTNSKFNDQLNQLQQYADYERKYLAVVSENDRINTTLRAKNEENEQLRTCISKLQLTLDNAKTHELENKIALLSSEIERLHQTLKCRSEELTQSRNQIHQLQNECNQISMINGDNMRLNNQLRSKNEEIDRLQIKLTQFQKEITSKQDKVSILSSEVETLTKQLRSKNEENEKTKLSIQVIQEASKKDLDGKLNAYSNEIDRLTNFLKAKTNEVEQFKVAYAKVETAASSIKLEYENKIKEQQQRFLLVSVENERLTGVLKLQVDEIKKLERCQFNEQEKISLQEKIKNLCQELDSWKQQFIVLNREYHKTQESLILVQAELDSYKNKRNSTANFNTENFDTFSYRNSHTKDQKSDQRQSNFQTGVLQNRNF